MPGSCEIAVVEKPKTVRKSRKKAPPKKAPPKKRKLPKHLKRPARVHTVRPISNIAVDPEAAQKLAEGLEKLKDLMMTTPGFMDSLKEILITISKGFPDVGVVTLAASEAFAADAIFNVETCTLMLQKLGEVLMEAGVNKGREEVMKEYALECLSKCLDPESEAGDVQ